MKKLLYIVLALVLIGCLGIAVLFFTVDPNQFKGEITKQVQNATGQELVINGDISWELFPSLGLSLGPIALKNPQGFAEDNFVQFSGASLNVSVMPLISQTLDIGQIELTQARLFVQTLKDGRSNFDAFTGSSKKDGTEDQAQQADASKEPTKAWDITFAGISVKDASIVIIDDKAGTKTSIDKLNFQLDRFVPGSWSALAFDVTATKDSLKIAAQGKTELFIDQSMTKAELKNLALTTSLEDGALNIESATLNIDQFISGKPSKIDFTVKGKNAELAFDNTGNIDITVNEDFTKILLQSLSVASTLTSPNLPTGKLTTKLNTKGSYTEASKTAELAEFDLTVNDTQFTGSASFKNVAIPVVRFDLRSKNIDLDQLLASTKSEEKVSSSKTGTKVTKTTPSDVEPDLAALKNIDLQGSLIIDKLKANNLTISAINTSMSTKAGIAEMKTFTAQLYEGKIVASAKIDARKSPASYVVKKDMTGVQAESLLRDLTGKKLLSGTMDLLVNLSGTGLSEKKLRSGIRGTVKADVLDGALWGVNIPQMVRKANGVIKGTESFSGLTSFSEGEKTDFSSMKVSMKIDKGLATTDDLLITAPLIRVAGAGKTSLITEKLDFLIKTTISKTVQKQEDIDLYGLKGSTIPIQVKGSWQDPQFQLSMEDLVKEKAQKEVQKGLDKLFKKDSSTEDTTNPAEQLLKGLFN